MKDFIEELGYMCSASNTKSRGLYIMIAIALIALPIAAIAMAVLLLINLIKYSAFVWYWAAILVFVIAVFIGLIVWLKKS